MPDLFVADETWGWPADVEVMPPAWKGGRALLLLMAATFRLSSAGPAAPWPCPDAPEPPSSYCILPLRAVSSIFFDLLILMSRLCPAAC